MQPLSYQSGASTSAKDADNINLLAIFHYIWGGLTLLFSCFMVIYIMMGIAFIRSPGAFAAPGATAAPPPVGWIFVGVGSALFLIGSTFGGLTLYSARSMQKRRRRVLSLVVAGLNCAMFPIGTTLGIFTFIILLRDTARQIYADEKATHG
jgi:hypothetical protein